MIRPRPTLSLRAGLLAALVATPLLASCGGDETTSAEPGNDLVPDLFGEYDDGFAVHRINGQRWRIGDDVMHLVYADNEAGWAVARNGTSNAFSPGLWSRLHWTTFEDRVWYCQIAFDAATRQAAFDVAAPDASAPATGGCAGFSWSTLTPVEPAIAGAYNDGFADHAIEGDLWTQTFDGVDSRYHLVQVSNEAGFAIALNDVLNGFGAGLWSRFDWVRSEGQLFYCQSAFDAPTRGAAYEASADRSSPASGGCAGFPWSPLEAP